MTTISNSVVTDMKSEESTLKHVY